MKEAISVMIDTFEEPTLSPELIVHDRAKADVMRDAASDVHAVPP